MSRLFGPRLPLFLLTVALSFIAVGGYMANELDREVQVTDPSQVFFVQQGDGVIRVLTALEAQGIIRSGVLSRISMALRGDTFSVKPGEYRLRRSETLHTLLQRFHDNDVVVYSVTIPEGVTFQWMLERLWHHPQVTRTLSTADDEAIASLIAPQTSPEGLFLPETYLISRGTSDIDVLRQARAAMVRQLEQIWRKRQPSIPLTEPYEALILASIIEKETGLGSERPEIGGVFTRRMKKGMRLQTDPTVIYGLGPDFDGNLKRSHLRDDTNPYNTYRISGLPPTPIALPGKAALIAATHPEPGETLYFVARGDGSHAFSKTLVEHEENVRRYQLKRKQNYRSSPR